MSDKLSVVLVHGFWGGAAHWAKVIVELNARGYNSLHAVENSLTSLYDDAERTQKMVKQIDGPVLLVGHSYGGAVITEAGDLPNVVGLVYARHSRRTSGRISVRSVRSAPRQGRITSLPILMATSGSRPTSSTRASARTFLRTKRL